MDREGAALAWDRDARERATVRPLEDVETATARLAAQVRAMAAANRALGAANDTLTASNTALRRDTAEAWADTAEARADTAEARADTAEARATTRSALTRNDELHATNEAMEARNDELHASNDAMGARNDDLEATVEAVERVNAELKAHRVAVQELAAVLEAERAQLAAILAGVEEAVLVVDRAGTTVRANAAYARLFGDVDGAVVMDDARGRPLSPAQTPRARAARGETFSLAFSVTTGERSVAGEDTRRWFVATGQPLHESGAPHGVVVIRDVTLADRQRRLQDEFLVLAGHELRTPLTSVQGYLDLLTPLLRTDSDARSRLYATRALRQTRRLVALVRDLTDAARLRNGTVTLDVGPVDLVPLVEQVVDTARALPPAHAIRLAAGAGPVWVSGDAGRLEQILFNLLSNAATHAPSERAIDVRLRRAGAAVALEVQDYGRGIAADHLPHLFTRFYQVARADRPSQGGLGLGLFLCQELIAAHGGRIEVVSREGAGTTFTVWLPLAGGETAARDATTVAALTRADGEGQPLA